MAVAVAVVTEVSGLDWVAVVGVVILEVVVLLVISSKNCKTDSVVVAEALASALVPVAVVVVGVAVLLASSPVGVCNLSND